MAASSLTQSELKTVLHYEPDTGLFTWLKQPSYRIKVGDIAGCDGGKGYIVIRTFGKLYLAHRLAWFYMTGAFPSKDIDHINGIKDCNKWDNLRECTNSQNHFNAGVRKDNTSGFKGVCWENRYKKWRARATLNDKTIYLGYHTTAEQASEVYQSFAKLHHGEFFKEMR